MPQSTIFASGVNFVCFVCFITKLFKFGAIKAVKFLACKYGSGIFLTNLMSVITIEHLECFRVA